MEYLQRMKSACYIFDHSALCWRSNFCRLQSEKVNRYKPFGALRGASMFYDH